MRFRWAPIYFYKDDTTTESGGAEKAKIGKPLKQKGHLHFEVAFFPVVRGKLIYAERPKPKPIGATLAPVEGESEEGREAREAEAKLIAEAEAEKLNLPAKTVAEYREF